MSVEYVITNVLLLTADPNCGSCEAVGMECDYSTMKCRCSAYNQHFDGMTCVNVSGINFKWYHVGNLFGSLWTEPTKLATHSHCLWKLNGYDCNKGCLYVVDINEWDMILHISLTYSCMCGHDFLSIVQYWCVIINEMENINFKMFNFDISMCLP